jgi:hypothetical protein
MYVSIDMDKLVFLHKHHDHETLSALAFLEAPDRSIMIENTERGEFLHKLSRLELCLLYKNTTGAGLVSTESQTLRFQLHDVVANMKARLAIRDEVTTQVAAVEDRLYAGKAFAYVLGAKLPTAPLELLGLPAKPLAPAQLDAAAHRAATAPVAPPPPPPVPAAPETPEPRQPGGARKPSVRPVVFAAADAAWAAAGKGTLRTWEQVKADVLADMMKQGYHQTTVRIKLSEWAKANNP